MIVSVIGINQENFFNHILGILLIIISAKLITPKKSRDILQIYLLNLLVVAASAVTRWGLEFGLLVLLEAFISVTGLIFIYSSNEQQEIEIGQVWHLFRWSSLITACLIPCTVFFFIILPRPTGTFFAFGGKSESKSGFSDRVSPGTVERIKVDTSPAFRVRWLQGSPPINPLWRGIVYDTYRRGVWEKNYQRIVELPKILAENVQYEILLEPTDSKYLLSLGLPYKILSKPLKPYLVEGYTIQILQGLYRRILYRVNSFILTEFPAGMPPGYYLEVPRGVADKLRPLAGRLIRETDLETARAVVFFLKNEFTYDISPGKAHGDPVIYFLSTSKKGHCEYFASAMVLLLRALGIPARMVGGYLGGDWNDMGRYFLVRQSDAHTWVEVWIEERGWVTFDPTPEVTLEKESILKEKIVRFVDFLRMRWYYWVLDYDIARQVDLAHKTVAFFRSLRSGDDRIKLSFGVPDSKDLVPFLIIGVSLFLLRIAWAHYHSRPKTWGERFVHIFQIHGYTKKPGETLQEFADKIATENILVGQKASLFVQNYYLLEYGQKGSGEILVQSLKDIDKLLKKKKGRKIVLRNN